MRHVVVMAQGQGFLVSSIQSHLEAMDYEVSFVEPNVDALSKIGSSIDAVLVYADEEMTDNQKTLVYLSDRIEEDEIPVFLAGSEADVVEVKQMLPTQSVLKIFLRPIDVRKATIEMDADIKEYHASRRKKILVVDDSGAMLRNVKGWLEGKYQVVLANSGMMAIKYLTQSRPDLILLDYEMPVCDGKQVLEMIRAESDFSDVPVIFLTSKGDRESVLNVMALKPSGYLLKTLPPEQIVDSIDKFFAKKS